MIDFASMTISDLVRPEGFDCDCGKHHRAGVQHLAIGAGVLGQLPDILKSLGVKKPFMLADHNTWEAAGARLCGMLDDSGLAHVSYRFPQPSVEPDEFSIGQALLAFDESCDAIIAVGSGTINDIGKILSKKLGLPQIAAATAPSMDGYASNSSALICGGIKSTIYSCCPAAIIADLDILRQAPVHMIQAGLGDILAKYNSICEWQISHLVTGEYYCEAVADLMRSAVRKCVANAHKLPTRDPEVIQAVTEGLILSGIAMSFAEISRPASGLEHYFSHIWEMRALENHKPFELHGIQVGVGTLLTSKLYAWLGETEPSRQRALDAVAAFDMQQWAGQTRRFFGKAAEGIIQIEEQSGKHDKAKHALRLERILEHWPEIVRIIRCEMPPYEELERIIRAAGGPVTPDEIGLSAEEVVESLPATMEIRDKYVGSRLLWDLGILDEMAERLKKYCESIQAIE